MRLSLSSSVRALALGALFIALTGAPARAAVVSLTLGISVNCPYGLVA